MIGTNDRILLISFSSCGPKKQYFYHQAFAIGSYFSVSLEIFLPCKHWSTYPYHSSAFSWNLHSENLGVSCFICLNIAQKFFVLPEFFLVKLPSIQQPILEDCLIYFYCMHFLQVINPWITELEKLLSILWELLISLIRLSLDSSTPLTTLIPGKRDISWIVIYCSLVYSLPWFLPFYS